jgi:hypothetical protein
VWQYETPAAVQVSRVGEMLGSGAVVSVLTSKEKKAFVVLTSRKK